MQRLKHPHAPPGRGLQFVRRTAAVLRALTEDRTGLTLSELSTAVGLPVSTTHRLVAALDEEGLVRAQPRGKIFLGPLITQRAQEQDIVLAPEVRHATSALAARVHETVDVAVLEGAALRFVAQSPGGGPLRAVSSVGVRFPLHCTGSGKAFLARLPRADASALLPRRLPRNTARTITARRVLWTELEEVRASGIGFDREEHHPGIASMATVVQDRRGAAVAISLVVPAVRFYDREDPLADELRRTALELGRRVASAHR